MGIAEKEGGFPVLDTDSLNTFFLPTAEIATRLPGKVGPHTSAAEGLRWDSSVRGVGRRKGMW